MKSVLTANRREMCRLLRCQLVVVSKPTFRIASRRPEDLAQQPKGGMGLCQLVVGRAGTRGPTGVDRTRKDPNKEQ